MEEKTRENEKLKKYPEKAAGGSTEDIAGKARR